MNELEDEMKKEMDDDNNFSRMFQMYLKKLDEFEHRFNEKIRRKRQRALCLLDVVPNYRKSHVRLFVSSRYDRNNMEYVLSFECRPLVGPSFETTSASLMDQDTRRKKLMTLEKKKDASSSSSSLIELNPMSIPLAWNISNRNTNGTTLQEDEVKFTNLWERIQICFQQEEKVSTLEWKQSKLRGEHQQNQYSFRAFLQNNQNTSVHQSSPALATICLYKEPTDTKNYIPSESLCQALFPSMTTSLQQWNDHTKKLKHNIFSNIATAKTENNHLFLPPHEYEQIPLENDFLILPMITIEEVLNVLYQYVQERNLLDQTDLGSFHLDEKLQRLFGHEQETIKLNNLRGLILQNRLLYEKQKQEPHIIIIHLLVKPHTAIKQQDSEANLIDSERKRKRNQINTSDDEKHIEDENDLVWYDVDLEVPHLFHTRVRDLLRRIKKRELEYTSSRTKAMMLYRNDHKLFKIRLEEAISNQNSYSKSHIPIHLAAAKACPPGSDAEGSALCDARMSYLIDQLQNSTQRLAHYHQILKACKSCSTDANDIPRNS